MAEGDAPTKEQVAELQSTIDRLKANNQEILGHLKSEKTRVAAFDGLDPEKVRNVLAEREKLEVEAQKVRGDWDAREKALRDSFAQEHKGIVEPLQTENKTLRSDLFDATAVKDAIEAMADPTIKANPALALPILRDELAVEIIDGARITVIKGSDGKPRYHPTTNKLVTVRDRLLELKNTKRYFGAFEGSGGSGSDMRNGDKPGDGGVGTITLTRQQAEDSITFNAALKQVGGDYSRLKIEAIAG